MKSISQPRIIILEGVDRSGKDSLIEALNKIAKYKHITIDRGPVGFKAYCEIFNKGYDNYDSYVRMEDNLSKNDDVLMIYLYASKEVLEERVAATDHEYIDYETHLPIYTKHFNRSPIQRKISFDTGRITAEAIVKALIRQGLV